MLVDDQKVCGILVERVNTRPPMVVIGIGINVDQTADELPVPTATSLALSGHPVDRTALFGDVVQHLRVWLGRFAGSPRHVRRTSTAAAARPSTATSGSTLPGDRVVEGRVVDIDAARPAAARRPPTAPLALSAGDVVHLRPAE